MLCDGYCNRSIALQGPHGSPTYTLRVLKKNPAKKKKNSSNLHPFLGAEKVFVHFNQLHTHKRCATQLGEIVHAEDDDT